MKCGQGMIAPLHITATASGKRTNNNWLQIEDVMSANGFSHDEVRVINLNKRPETWSLF